MANLFGDVSILLGTGTGSFGAAANFAAGLNPYSVAVGDFNADGNSDLAVANVLSNDISILLGTGTGSFGAASNFAVGTAPISVAVGDFNVDGKPDLAVAHFSSDHVSILINTCSPPTPTPTVTPTPTLAVGCPQVPHTGCRMALKSLVFLKNNADDSKDKLIWKWIKGQATTQAELGDPTLTAGYRFCVYDASGFLLGASVPPSTSKWSRVSDKGYKYKDTNGSADGITKVLLKGNASEQRSKALVKGKGTNLPDPVVGSLTLPVTAQLRNMSTGVCIEGVYESGDVIKNDAGQFKAKAQ